MIILFFLYGGAILLGMVLMALATVFRKSATSLVLLFALSIFSLLFQYGCWKAAAGIGRATGGGSDDLGSTLLFALAGSAGAFIVWFLVLLLARSDSKSRSASDVRRELHRQVDLPDDY